MHRPPRGAQPASGRAQQALPVLVVLLLAAASSGCGRRRGSEPFDAFRQHYLLPRGYPSLRVDPQKRDAALDHLAQMHQAGSPHLNPGVAPAGGACVWTAAGPTNVNGRVTSIAIDRTDAHRIFVATVGGVWRSTDGGRRWARVLGSARPGVFGAVALQPDDGSIVYAGGGDPNYQDAGWGGGPGIWRSTDGGDSWSPETGPELDGAVVFRIVVGPAPSEVYAATSLGVWHRISDSGGVRWEVLDGMAAPCSDIAVDFRGASHRVYAGVYEDQGSFARRIWRHDGSGWSAVSSGIPSGSGIVALGMAPSNPDIIYARLERKSDGSLLGVYRTNDGGASWKRKTDSLPDDSADYNRYNCSIAVHPDDPDIVFTGGLDLYRSANGGDDWEGVSPGRDLPRFKYSDLHLDQHAIAFDPAQPAFLYVGNDGGLYRSTDMTMMDPSNEEQWHWQHISHGMATAELYRICATSGKASTFAIGSQDNGSQLTFGDRTWYVHEGCDGGYVAVDAGNLIGFYQSCNGTLQRYGDPIPGKPGWGRGTTWEHFPHPSEPVATDPTTAGRAVAVSWKDGDRPQLRYTEDGVDWHRMQETLPREAMVTALAIGPSSDFKTFYVGFRGDGGSVRSSIWTTTDRGAEWAKPADCPDLSPNAIAVDSKDPARAFAAFGGMQAGAGGVYMTGDGGTTWKDISGSGPTGLPSTPMTGIVIDPVDHDVLYASSFVGVFKGTLSAGADAATWAPFDEGLPEGLDVNDIVLSADNQLIMIGTKGYGVFSRHIGDPCPTAGAMVRDNVFDRGFGPAPQAMANPEDPVGPDREGRYEPNPTAAGSVYWWTSTDIRVVVPGRAPVANQVDDADHVEFETCAIPSPTCDDGVIQDMTPQAGDQAKVIVQVTNPGVIPIHDVRVTVLWNQGVIPAPPLPGDFWTKTFPSDADCGDLDGSTGWRYVDPAGRCQKIDLIRPEIPETKAFDWSVPPGASAPFQYLAIVEAPSDLLGDARTKLAMDELVPGSPGVALRALVVASGVTAGTPLVEPVELKVEGGLQGVELVVAAADRAPGDLFAFYAPRSVPLSVTGATPDTTLDSLGAVPLNTTSVNLSAYSIADSARVTGFPAIPRVEIGIAYAPSAPLDRARYINAVVRNGAGRVLGGMTWVVRPMR